MLKKEKKNRSKRINVVVVVENSALKRNIPKTTSTFLVFTRKKINAERTKKMVVVYLSLVALIN